MTVAVIVFIYLGWVGLPEDAASQGEHDRGVLTLQGGQ